MSNLFILNSLYILYISLWVCLLIYYENTKIEFSIKLILMEMSNKHSFNIYVCEKSMAFLVRHLIYNDINDV